jgi:tripartite-type tricarboxylate transporter receptor subunit TctC
MMSAIRIAGCVAALLAATVSAKAEYPDKSLRMVLHVSPGGGTDVMARKLGNALQGILGQTLVIDNRAGGRGASQMAELRMAKPDGYTIGSVTNTHIATFHQTLRQYNVDSVDWIAKLVSEPYLIVVQNDSPIKSLRNLMDTIKAAPGKTVIAGFTRGSGSHIAWEMLMRAAGLPGDAANWVPYDSVADGVTAVLGGHGVATVAYVDLVRDNVEAGKLRVIGVMTDKPLAQFPNAPTFKDQGFDVPSAWQQWRGVIAPKGIPDPIKQKLADAVKEALATPDMQAYLKSSSLEYNYLGPKDFTAFAHEQDVLTVNWLKTLGMLK